MKNNVRSVVILLASCTLAACAGSTGGSGNHQRAAASTSGAELPPGVAPTAGGILFMSCVSKLDGGPDLTELRVGGGRYLVCTSYDNNAGQGTTEVTDDDGNRWDLTWSYDDVKAGGSKDVVLALTTNVLGQPFVVTATRDGDEIVIPIPTWSGAEASPIWVDVGGKVTSWTPATVM